MFDEIPLFRPLTPLLDQVNSPADLRQLEEKELPQLARELREFLLYSVGQTGGHFGAGLGVVELTIALHYCYNTPEDRLVWDVGHQTYPHKILTGRREEMLTMRQAGGLSGFPKRAESEYDTFGVGHSSTSISAALGMALGAEMDASERKNVAIIGDGAMTAGMAFEALTHAAHTETDMLVVLNDNNMSISRNVGGLANYFSKVWASKLYTNFREGSKKVLSKIPQAWELARKTEEHMKGMVSPGTLFEELGFYYIGPIDGHDLDRLTHDLANLRSLPGPKLLHIITRKGKGFAPAEADPVGYHALNKIEPKPKVQVATPTAPKKQKYQDIFGDWLCDMAAQDDKLVGITPAMCEGSGMVEFAERFADRFYDVAIAEQHAVTLGAGLACEGQKPVVAIYSTFLQRAYDQLIHDVAIQNLDVTFAIDRAGLVGEDGPTHAGSFDLSFLRCIPNMLIAAPSDENECRQLLTTAFKFKGPGAVRYPRGTGPGNPIDKALTPLPIGKGVIKREGLKVAILNFGTLLSSAMSAAEQLNASVCDMRFVKPLDTELIRKMADKHDLLVTLEENTVAGGAGSAVMEWLAEQGIVTPVLPLGLPDVFIEHGKHDALLDEAGLSAGKILTRIQQRLAPTQTQASAGA
ncbi:1-deoxy-D-xylulose-5-phosphate synthase [Aestuariicella hydrocarbonica]|uniref:1-deoxy-D-xylulose-5-phosphate synthase n=1 Tax=Pseudomaricurvus hydrocarbonicus TaxID=1470433 RepID=A0A9E5MNI9_9GAMM|nr:1-deoxy-D-xylulose-5-phosphate synthase [Aestuariicella hydrocarbonica]NHO67521.1 1-deoxy-D-xylulose-5-phosphate synthase [Aestuariicella hydrocarbonica]